MMFCVAVTWRFRILGRAKSLCGQGCQTSMTAVKDLHVDSASKRRGLSKTDAIDVWISLGSGYRAKNILNLISRHAPA
jgi:hypothetical protein